MTFKQRAVNHLHALGSHLVMQVRSVGKLSPVSYVESSSRSAVREEINGRVAAVKLMIMIIGDQEEKPHRAAVYSRHTP